MWFHKTPIAIHRRRVTQVIKLAIRLRNDQAVHRVAFRHAAQVPQYAHPRIACVAPLALGAEPLAAAASRIRARSQPRGCHRLDAPDLFQAGLAEVRVGADLRVVVIALRVRMHRTAGIVVDEALKEGKRFLFLREVPWGREEVVEVSCGTCGTFLGPVWSIP